MATPDIESPDRTDLKQIDHAHFFEAMDSPPLPTEALGVPGVPEETTEE